MRRDSAHEDTAYRPTTALRVQSKKVHIGDYAPSMSQSMPSKPDQPLRATVPSFHFFHIVYEAAESLHREAMS